MLSVNRVIKFLWILSLIIFLSGLLYGYYILPDAVCIHFDSKGDPMEYIARKNAFYFFSGICAGFNILLLILERLVLLIPDRLKPIPNKSFWLSNDETRQALNFTLSNWFFTFAIILNTCLLGCFYAFTKVNSNFQSSIFQYYWIFQTVTVIIILWIIYLPVRLFISKIFIR